MCVCVCVNILIWNMFRGMCLLDIQVALPSKLGYESGDERESSKLEIEI